MTTSGDPWELLLAARERARPRMTQREREVFANEWHRKYTGPLEPFEIVASVLTVARSRFVEAIVERARDYWELLAKQQAERKEFMRTPLRGARDSLDDQRWAAERAQGPDSPEPVWVIQEFCEFVDAFDANDHESRCQLIAFVLRMETFERQVTRAEQRGTKRTEIAFGRAIHELAEETRYGSPIREACWKDVKRALEWFGHDLARTDTNDLKAFQQRYLAATGKQRRPWPAP